MTFKSFKSNFFASKHLEYLSCDCLNVWLYMILFWKCSRFLWAKFFWNLYIVFGKFLNLKNWKNEKRFQKIFDYFSLTKKQSQFSKLTFIIGHFLKSENPTEFTNSDSIRIESNSLSKYKHFSLCDDIFYHLIQVYKIFGNSPKVLKSRVNISTHMRRPFVYSKKTFPILSKCWKTLKSSPWSRTDLIIFQDNFFNGRNETSWHILTKKWWNDVWMYSISTLKANRLGLNEYF